MKNAATTLKNWYSSSKLKSTRWFSFPAEIDLPLVITVLGLLVFGLIMVYSSSFIYAQEKTGDGLSFIKKQLLFAFFGFFGLWLACRVPYRKWGDWAMPLLLGATTLLALVMVPGIGSRVGGAQRWIRLGGLNIQPAELSKFVVLMFVAKQLELKQKQWTQLLLPVPALFLLLAQPDFGTTVIICLVGFLLLFLAGAPKRYLAAVLAIGLMAGLVLALGSAYRRERVLTFLDPWRDPQGKGFQVIQSLLGLHHGSIWGVGLGNGKEKLFYLPEAHNDFIFAVIGEELGFIGLACVVAAYLFLVYRGLKISWNAFKLHNEAFAFFLGASITLVLGLQGFINMSVALGLLPTKGLTLPFVSYGGSAMMVDLFAVGILLNIARGPRHHVAIFKKPIEV